LSPKIIEQNIDVLTRMM